jgi:hypothetical protein
MSPGCSRSPAPRGVTLELGDECDRVVEIELHPKQLTHVEASREQARRFVETISCSFVLRAKAWVATRRLAA